MTKSKTLRVQMVAAVTAMLLVSFMVVRTSSAAFTDDIDSGAQSIDAATLVFDSATVAGTDLSVTNILPGDFAETVCYDVTYGGSVTPSALALTASVTGTNGTDEALLGLSGGDLGTTLDEYLDLTVSMGAAGETCSSLLSGGVLDGLLTNYSVIFPTAKMNTFTSVDLAAASWTPSGTDTRAFVFELSLPDVGNAAQGDGVDATFTWSADQ